MAFSDNRGEDLPQMVLVGMEAVSATSPRASKEHKDAATLLDEALRQSLARLPVEGRLGVELFQVVATLITHVFALDAQRKGDLHD